MPKARFWHVMTCQRSADRHAERKRLAARQFVGLIRSQSHWRYLWDPAMRHPEDPDNYVRV
eukprot:1253919-Pleurochrysis_carterae.AAC.1